MAEKLSRRENGLQDLHAWVLSGATDDVRAVGLRFDGETVTIKRFQNATNVSADDFSLTDFKKFAGIPRRSKSEAPDPDAE